MPECYADYINNNTRDLAELNFVRRQPACDVTTVGPPWTKWKNSVGLWPHTSNIDIRLYTIESNVDYLYNYIKYDNIIWIYLLVYLNTELLL